MIIEWAPFPHRLAPTFVRLLLRAQKRQKRCPLRRDQQSHDLGKGLPLQLLQFRRIRSSLGFLSQVCACVLLIFKEGLDLWQLLLGER